MPLWHVKRCLFFVVRDSLYCRVIKLDNWADCRWIDQFSGVYGSTEEYISPPVWLAEGVIDKGICRGEGGTCSFMVISGVYPGGQCGNNATQRRLYVALVSLHWPQRQRQINMWNEAQESGTRAIVRGPCLRIVSQKNAHNSINAPLCPRGDTFKFSQQSWYVYKMLVKFKTTLLERNCACRVGEDEYFPISMITFAYYIAQ